MTEFGASKNEKKQNHSLIIENRESVTLSGVKEIGRFDETTVVLYTDYGEVTLTGTGLSMSKLSVDSGDVAVAGKIHSLSYSENGPRHEKLFKRLFK